MTSEIITPYLKKTILAKTYFDTNNRKCIDLGNCRLDFSKTYFFIGFTKKGVKLSYSNGDLYKEINVLAKVEKRNDYYALYTEGWNYIEHLELESTEAKE